MSMLPRPVSRALLARRATSFALAPLLLGPVAAASAAAVSDGAVARPTASPQAYVVQGVPGVTVDVSLDGRSVGSDVAAKDIVPVELTSGSHTVTFESPRWSVDASFSSGHRSLDLVLHRPADPTGDPVVTVFTNQLAPVGSGEGRVTVAHTAVVPPADVRANGKVLFANIANGEFVTAEVPADTYSVDVVPTGGGAPLLGPVDLPVAGGKLTRVFAIGAPRNGSMDAIVQVLALPRRAGTPPSGVDAGSAGLVAPGGPGPSRAGIGVLIAGALLAGGSLLASARRRRHVG